MIDFCNPEDGDPVWLLSILNQQFWHNLGTIHRVKEKQPLQLIVLQRLTAISDRQAERGGFEPPVRVAPDTAFPVPHNRPLCHLSGVVSAD